MKKNSLTSAIIAGVAGVAGLAGVANAVNLNPDGVGQVLLYPYYTVNADQSTLVTVVNTADVAKAVKVRFLESLNSAEVLDFNLYLSAHDVWTGEVYLDNGVPGMLTTDKSCISPRNLTNVFEPFRDYEFTYWRPDLLGRSVSPLNLARQFQGHIEIIEMGDLGGDVASAVTHINGTPRNCALVRNYWAEGGTWTLEAGAGGKGLTDVYPPGSGYIDNGQVAFNENGGPGGIYGSGVIVNVAEGTSYGYNAYAINGFYTLDENLHYAPGSISPNLGQAETALGEATATVFDAAGTAYNFTFESGSVSSAPAAVSAVLSARYIANDYVAIPGFASSDWVVTFPTKRLHTYRPIGSPEVAPFTNAQGVGSNGSAGTNVFEGSWPEVIEVQYWDQEEGTPIAPVTPGDVSPLPPPTEPTVLAFRQEANVFSFAPHGVAAGTATPVLGTPLNVGGTVLELEDGFQAGWARIGFGNQLSDGNNTIVGLPVIGFWAAKFINGNVGGALANYTFTHPHRVAREIGSAAGN